MKMILSFFLAVVFSACSMEPLAVHRHVSAQRTGANQAYVANHGWHTGFIIPAAALRESIPEFGRRFGGEGHIEIGWGDRGFYQAEKITAGLAVRAIFWPSESVVHAVAVPTDPLEYFPNSKLVVLTLDDAELASLVQFVSGSLYRDGGGKPVPLGDGLYGDSQFYQGVGDYHLMNTCNKWTAKGLESAGMDISPAFMLTAGSVMDCLSAKAPPARAPSRPPGKR